MMMIMVVVIDDKDNDDDDDEDDYGGDQNEKQLPERESRWVTESLQLGHATAMTAS